MKISSNAPELLLMAELNRLGSLSASENGYIRGLLGRKLHYRAGNEIIKMGDLLDAPVFLLSGWACVAAFLPDGRRQILDFYLPGDIVGYSSRVGARAKGEFIALTVAECASASGMNSNSRPLDRDGLDRVLRASEEEREQRLVNQIIRNGRQTAVESVASLIVELYIRVSGTTEMDDGTHSLTIPITQEMMADALGLSVVHVNRTLKILRHRSLIASRGFHTEILDFSMLADLAQVPLPGALIRNDESAAE